jgi:predicted alpha/beta superfamily hydrolase
MHSVTALNKKLLTTVLEINLKAALPEGEQLYVTGNLPELKNWDPAGRPLLPDNSGRCSINLSAPKNQIIECKLTRGSWKTQAILSADDIPPSNLVIKVTRPRTVKVSILNWLDQLKVESDPIQGRLVNLNEIAGIKPSRKISIWLPDSYSNDSEPHSVIYMHDGQNLFEPSAAFAGVDWKVDESINRLIAANQIKKTIVVAIPNSEYRMEELNLFTDRGKSYARYIVDRVKPVVDKNFNIHKDAANTFVMGSSMGGLMSFQMAVSRPDIFGGAGCLSSAFSKAPELFNYLEKSYLHPEKLRIYIDTGEYEPPIVKDYFQMMHFLKSRGYTEGFNLMGCFDEKATHCEAAWAKRLELPLRFLLKN